jgi:phosphohistidine phosphatase
VELFLIRHAEAEARKRGARDEARSLSTDGRRRWKQAVRGLASLETTFDRVYHSPSLRAVETAERLRRLVRHETVVTSALSRRPTRALLAELEGERVAVVGHHPWLEELAGILIFGDARRGARFTLCEGTIMHLEGAPRRGGMILRALLPQKVLRALSQGR